jgi:preprotein translocase subunit SecY
LSSFFKKIIIIEKVVEKGWEEKNQSRFKIMIVFVVFLILFSFFYIEAQINDNCAPYKNLDCETRKLRAV